VRSQRIFWFVFAIAAGMAGGLLLGWIVIPGKGPVNTTPATLRADYRTDVVLMTAEIFQQERDPSAAAARLAEFDPGQSPVRMVQQAILDAQNLGYSRPDIESMARLFQALQEWTPTLGTDQP
jgi:hypothetical protein